MKKAVLLLGAATLALGALAMVNAQSKTVITVFMGTQQRPDVFNPLFDQFERKNPQYTVKIETGGATSELQNQYLTTVMTAKDPSLDIYLADVIRPAQYAKAGWAESLDKYMGDDAAVSNFFSGFLPGPVNAGTINAGKGQEHFSIPAFTDSQFLYYRKDLLAKYDLKVPRTWDEMVKSAQIILRGENKPNLQGFNFQGAPIEGTVCTFLQPFWGAGGSANLLRAGKVDVNNASGRQALQFLVDSIDKYKITIPSIGEVRTDDSRKQMQSGDVVFGLNWSYAWAHFQGNSPQETKVKGQIGVAPIPSFDGKGTSSCVGGWQWMVSAFSKNKEGAFKLLTFMASPAIQQQMSVNGAYLPVRKSMYNSSAVLKANPHFDDLYRVIINSKPRPVSADYPRVSEVIRTNVNAVVSKSKSIDTALSDMQLELAKVMEAK
jgi:multiple sugar transport system substrate-binding protein